MEIYEKLEQGIKMRVEGENFADEIVIQEEKEPEEFQGYALDFSLTELGGGSVETSPSQEDEGEKLSIRAGEQELKGEETLQEEKATIILGEAEGVEGEKREVGKEEIIVEIEKATMGKEIKNPVVGGEEIIVEKEKAYYMEEEQKQEKLEQEKLEQEKLEKEKLEKEKLEKEKLEKEKLEKEKLEQEKLEKEKLEKEALEEEPEWLEDVEYHKGMTLEEYIRKNDKSMRGIAQIGYIFTKEEIDEAVISGRVLVRKGVYRV